MIFVGASITFRFANLGEHRRRGNKERRREAAVVLNSSVLFGWARAFLARGPTTPKGPLCGSLAIYNRWVGPQPRGTRGELASGGSGWGLAQ